MPLRFLVGLLLAWCFASTAAELRLRIDPAFIASNDSFAVIEPLWWSVSIYDGAARYESDLARFSLEQRYVLACHWYISEVNNGGHSQFFDNSTGIVWRDAVAGFRAVGLSEIAEVLVEAGRRMGGTPSMDRSERQATLQRLQPDFTDLDSRLYALKNKYKASAPLTQYVRRNASAFVFTGTVTRP